MYESKAYSFRKDPSGKIDWKSSGTDNYSGKTDLKGVANSSSIYPKILNGKRMSITFDGNYMKQDKVVYLFYHKQLHCLQIDTNKKTQINHTINTLVMEFVLIEIVILPLVI